MNLEINNKPQEEKMNPFLLLRSKLKDENGLPVSTRKMEKLFNGAIKAQHISALEIGREKPSIKQLKVYHDYFNVSYEYLLGETTDTTNPVSKECFKSDMEKSIDYLATKKEKDEKMMYQFADMLFTSDKGLALLFYLSEYFYGKQGEKEEYVIEDGLIYKTKEFYNNAIELDRLKIRLNNIKLQSDELTYNEIRLTND